MYARWRIDNGQAVNAVVLLGPTFVSYRENDPVDGNPTKYDGWKIYMNYLIQNGVDILVVSDGPDSQYAKGFTPSPAQSGQSLGNYEYMEPFPGEPHYSAYGRGTNNNAELKQLVYNWIFSNR